MSRAPRALAPSPRHIVRAREAWSNGNERALARLPDGAIVIAAESAREAAVNEHGPLVVLPLVAMRAAVESIVRVAFDHALAERVAAIVAERLGAAASAEVYTTGKAGPHIPGKSRDWMLRHLKTMPGAVKIGRDWQISRADVVAWQRTQDVARVRAAPKRAIIEPDDEALAEEALRNAGYRTNGRRAG